MGSDPCIVYVEREELLCFILGHFISHHQDADAVSTVVTRYRVSAFAVNDTDECLFEAISKKEFMATPPFCQVFFDFLFGHEVYFPRIQLQHCLHRRRNPPISATSPTPPHMHIIISLLSILQRRDLSSILRRNTGCSDNSMLFRLYSAA